MKESDWLSSNDPIALIRHLVRTGSSERKLRLLACACCRQIWDLLPDERSRAAVIVAERFADELATPRELARARNEALAVGGGGPAWAPYWATNSKASGPLANVFEAVAAAPAKAAAQRAADHRADAWMSQQTQTLADQVALIREVFGNPFRPVPIDPHWLSYDGGIVVHLAEGIYQDHAFERMPILGDALEEAGCDLPEVLEHCRHSSQHVRGCWLLDELTGRF